MTWMLATVSGPEEAEIALGAGADLIDLADPADPPLGGLDTANLQRAIAAVAGRAMVAAAAGNAAPAPARVRELAGLGIDWLRVSLPRGAQRTAAIGDLAAVAGDIRLLAVLMADHGEGFAVIDDLAEAGFAGVMLDTADKTSGRLLEYAAPRRLAEFVALGRAKGLMVGLAGGLEAPDVPRLLPLKPDFLGFRRALCRNHDRLNSLESQAVAAMRGLMAEHGREAVEAAEHQGDSFGPPRAGSDGVPERDRVLVRDLVLPVSIGAYRHERHKPQRVRFAVTAEVAGGARASDDMDAVFSYDVIVDAIRALAEDRHVNLVETLAEEIAAKVLENPQVRLVTVRVEKLDAGPAVVGVEIVRRAP